MGEAVGVDIEYLNENEEKAPVVAALSEAEIRKLAEVPPADRRREFLKIWTMKEAYAKWRGEGVWLDFAAISLDDSRAVSEDAVHIWSMSFGQGYIIAFASRRDTAPSLRFANLNESMTPLEACPSWFRRFKQRRVRI